jgi:4-amino-4-deoxy-L-arabinose transferase-like glycosyltransferase
MSALLRSRYTPVCLIALVSLAAHLLAAGRYGFHRDELYYIACGMHPAWGYVDHPALTPMLARLAVALFGGSLVGLRLFAALAAAAVIVLSGQIAREMGGGPFAAALAALAVSVGTIFVSAGHLFQTVPFDQVVWAVAALILARILARGADGAGWPWLTLGATLGVGAHTKSTVVALGVGIAAGVLFTPTRRWLRTRWPWLGALLAVAIALPNLIWQATHGWPTLEFSRNSASAYWHGRSPALFLLLQPVFVGIGGLALACIGLWWCFSAHGGRFRAFGWLFVAAVVVLLAARGKEYYPAPAYLPLIAAGAVATEAAARRAAWLRRASVATVVALALPFIPVALPVLPARTMLDARLYTLDADNVEQIGWPELVETVNGVYQQLPPDERAHAQILTANWGEAGAVDFFGERYGLPHAISGHDTYYLWGPGDPDATTYIAVGFPVGRLAPYFAAVTPAATITNALDAPNQERGRPVLVCRQPRVPLAQVWPAFKHYT